MSVSPISPAAAADPAVLLVLLPPTGGAAGQPQQAALRALQHRLGPAIRVLKIDEASHPTVVRSFRATELPACVLVRRGIELWRQPGLPEGEELAALLLSKLAAPPVPVPDVSAA